VAIDREPDSWFDELRFCDSCRTDMPHIVEIYSGALTAYCAKCGNYSEDNTETWEDEVEMDCL
jgi:hypothetical protein